jgi:hypothetical protein
VLLWSLEMNGVKFGGKEESVGGGKETRRVIIGNVSG